MTGSGWLCGGDTRPALPVASWGTLAPFLASVSSSVGRDTTSVAHVPFMGTSLAGGPAHGPQEAPGCLWRGGTAPPAASPTPGHAPPGTASRKAAWVGRPGTRHSCGFHGSLRGPVEGVTVAIRGSALPWGGPGERGAGFHSLQGCRSHCR